MGRSCLRRCAWRPWRGPEIEPLGSRRAHDLPFRRVHDEALADIIHQASARPEVRRAVGELYASVQREIDARRPRCEISGRCCRFEEYGHRLYVTTIELAAFAHELEQRRGGD